MGLLLQVFWELHIKARTRQPSPGLTDRGLKLHSSTQVIHSHVRCWHITLSFMLHLGSSCLCKVFSHPCLPYHVSLTSNVNGVTQQRWQRILLEAAAFPSYFTTKMTSLVCACNCRQRSIFWFVSVDSWKPGWNMAADTHKKAEDRE